ncbi:MAG: hypothetical protein RMK01_04070 [Thermomicrobium sp.]|nr:hypothetical protein [Thermomicrobium sp.]
MRGPFALSFRKAGRTVILGKVVWVGDSWVFGVPYRTRRLSTPSLPLAALEFLERAGVTHWVVRLDSVGRAYALPLSQVRSVGAVRDGEIYVPLRRFAPCPYPDWSYVTEVVEVRPCE